MAYYLPWLSNTSGGGTDPYTWYPSFNKNLFPPHTASGVWGAQSTVKEAVGPTTTRNVSCATLAEVEAEIYTPGTRITLTGNISGGAFNDNAITDIDIVVPSGILMSGCTFGAYASTPLVNRLRIRGSTVGVYGGGQIHNTILRAESLSSSDFIIDGLDVSGSAVGSGALGLGGGPSFSRGAIVNCRIAAGGYAIGSTISDLVVAGCSILTGLDTAAESSPTDEEAYGIRAYFETNGNTIVYGCDIRSNPARVVSAHSRFRSHPDSGLDYIWAYGNTFVERVQSHIFQVDNDAGGGSGTAGGVWFDNNSVIAASTGTGAVVLGFSSDSDNNSSDYVYITNNSFQSDTFTADGTIPMNAVTSLTKSGNSYASLPGSDPAWGAAGDPSGIDWSP